MAGEKLNNKQFSAASLYDKVVAALWFSILFFPGFVVVWRRLRAFDIIHSPLVLQQNRLGRIQSFYWVQCNQNNWLHNKNFINLLIN